MHFIQTFELDLACDSFQPTVQRGDPKSPDSTNLNGGDDAATRFDS